MPKTAETKDQANRLVNTFLIQTMRALETPEPVLIEMVEQLQAQGGNEEIVEFLDAAIDAMALARGRLDHARTRILAKAS